MIIVVIISFKREYLYKVTWVQELLAVRSEASGRKKVALQMRAPARLHLLGAGIMGTVQREMLEEKKREMHLVSRNWNKQGNHRRWLRAARGWSRIKDEALQAELTGWSSCWSVGGSWVQMHWWAGKWQRRRSFLRKEHFQTLWILAST